jgi:hypothetical protein
MSEICPRARCGRTTSPSKLGPLCSISRITRENVWLREGNSATPSSSALVHTVEYWRMFMIMLILYSLSLPQAPRSAPLCLALGSIRASQSTSPTSKIEPPRPCLTYQNFTISRELARSYPLRSITSIDSQTTSNLQPNDLQLS